MRAGRCGNGLEKFELTQPPNFLHAMVDAASNMTAFAATKTDFTAAEIRRYILIHWDTLMHGYGMTSDDGRPILELTGATNGTPFYDKSSKYETCL